MAMASTTTTPQFRLLLNGQDGSIPYLTPELMRLVFCPDDGCDSSNNGNDGTDNSSSHADADDWKWRREHLILGVAVKDTCVTAVYREASLKKRKKKNGNGGANNGNDRSAKRAKNKKASSEAEGASAAVGAEAPSVSNKNGDSAATEGSAPAAIPDESNAASNNQKGDITPNGEQPKKNDESNAKKPAGYTFLTPSKASQIATEISSHSAQGGSCVSEKETLMHAHLKIPKYLSTMIVPTFSLDYPQSTTNIDANNNGNGNGEKDEKLVKVNEKDDKKSDSKKSKWESSKQNNTPKQKQQQKQKGIVIPTSTKDSMPVDTPNGWQKIGPEQYWDAVSSLTLPLSSMSASESTVLNATGGSKSIYEGAVGLFDHMGIGRDKLDYLFAEFMKGRNNGTDNSTALTPKAQQSISLLKPTTSNGKWGNSLQRMVHRTNEWSCRTQSYYEQKMQEEKLHPSSEFWTPVHMASSHLPLDSLFARPRTLLPQKKVLSSPSNVAIVGWDAISYSREHRRQALRHLMTTLQSSPTLPKQYLVLSVSDLPSILDAVRGGMSIIGTDMVRQWSLGRKALCLDLTLDGSGSAKKDKSTDAAVPGGIMDLKDEKYARDSLPLLPGCKCLACRPRRRGTGSCTSTDDAMNVPSFTRAYIHHLIKAKEMLAETLLFVHNLHQILLMFRQLNRAASLDGHNEGASSGEGMKGNLETLCQQIERQLQL